MSPVPLCSFRCPHSCFQLVCMFYGSSCLGCKAADLITPAQSPRSVCSSASYVPGPFFHFSSVFADSGLRNGDHRAEETVKFLKR